MKYVNIMRTPFCQELHFIPFNKFLQSRYYMSLDTHGYKLQFYRCVYITHSAILLHCPPTEDSTAPSKGFKQLISHIFTQIVNRM